MPKSPLPKGYLLTYREHPLPGVLARIPILNKKHLVSAHITYHGIPIRTIYRLDTPLIDLRYALLQSLPYPHSYTLRNYLTPPSE